MTDRIDLLAKQCWNHRIDGTLIDGHLHFDYRKFAELIVRECVSQMEWQKISPKGEGAYNSALDLAQRNIKEHFGVES